MQNSPNTHFFRQLQDDFFDYLDDQAIEYLDYETAEQGYVFTSVKPKYQMSADEMAREIGYANFAEFIEKAKAEQVADKTRVEVEMVFGRYVISFDGRDLYVNDKRDNQHVILSLTIGKVPEDHSLAEVELLCTGVVETIKKHKKTQEAL